MLFGDPGREFYLREIVAFAKSGVGQVQRELNRLVRSGLVLREPKGNQVWFRANPDGSVYAELVGIVAKTFGIADFIRMALVPVAARLRAAFIYGSVARGQHRATATSTCSSSGTYFCPISTNRFARQNRKCR